MGFLRLDGASAIIIIICALSGVLLYQSYAMPPIPALMPRLVSFAVMLLSAYFLISRLFFSGSQSGSPGGAGKGEGGMPYLLSVVLMLGYWVCTCLAGLLVATFIYMLVVPFLMGSRKPVSLVAVALVVTLLLFGSFNFVFHIPLPKGVLI